ncbi:hypothetical protein Q1695_005647 [Nippostrongylus brasiliensis]|nr:hypothetical protein Q1695_005647 [Nippostrongylus brasiliensis]
MQYFKKCWTKDISPSCPRVSLLRVRGTQTYALGWFFDGLLAGIEIMLTYKYGSMSDCKEGRGCFVKEMQWLGFKPSDASVLPIMSHQFIGLYNRDFVKITRIRRRAERLREYDVVKELDLLRSMRCKLELEAVSSIAPQFIINGYLLYRLPAPVPVCYRSPNQALVDEQLEASTVVICGNH